MKKNKVQNIFFDIGGVLVVNEDIDWSGFDEKYSLKRGEAREIFNDCYDQQKKGEDINMKKYFNKKYSDQLSWEKFQRIREKVFNSEKLNSELIDWIKSHRDDYRIGLMTNNTKALEELLKNKFTIIDLFDVVFNSAEMGVKKPDKRFFKMVLEEINAEEKECLLIDNKRKNTTVAKAMGFQTILFKSNKSFFKQVEKIIS